jgi:eukaryotic-like serine/threonine-protein kinase
VTTLAGRYELGRELGSGGMAKVFLGTDTRLNRQVAVKVLSPVFAQDEAFVARFRREAQAAARLNHPDIVSVFDSGSINDVHYIVMEYVQGKTLAEVIATDGKLLPERAAQIAEEVAAALSAAHTQGIVHRDIKPANIMITTSGQVKVMDFGIAHIEADGATQAQTKAVVGTAAYLSPEQAQGAPMDARSDIYSLGIVLFQMLTGRVPFTGDNATAVAVQHVQQQPPAPSAINPSVPPAYDYVVGRALEKNPASRYQSANEMLRDLERVRLGEAVVPSAGATQVLPPSAGVAPPEESPIPDSSGTRWGIGILIGLIVVAFLVGAFLLGRNILSGGDEPSPSPSAGAQTAQVPNLLNLTRLEAEQRIRDEGFTIGDERFKPSSETNPGRVFRQSPSALMDAPKGSAIDIWIAEEASPTASPSAATAGVPSVVGMTQSKAEKTLTDAGFALGTPTEESSDTVPEGKVIRQDPRAGAQFATGTAVDIWVSTGSGTVAVPPLACLSTGKALNQLQALGLDMQIVDPPSPNSACPQSNKVGSQDTPAGTQVPLGTVIDVHRSGP